MSRHTLDFVLLFSQLKRFIMNAYNVIKKGIINSDDIAMQNARGKPLPKIMVTVNKNYHLKLLRNQCHWLRLYTEAKSHGHYFRESFPPRRNFNGKSIIASHHQTNDQYFMNSKQDIYFGHCFGHVLLFFRLDLIQLCVMWWFVQNMFFNL